MFVNPEQLPHIKKYKCNKRVMRYLVYDCHLTIFALGEEKDTYYFIMNSILQECLDKMPFWIKALSLL